LRSIRVRYRSETPEYVLMIGETFRHLRDQILRLLKEKVNTTKDIGLINKMLFFSEPHKLSKLI